MTTLLEVRDVHVQFGGVQAVRDLSIDVDEGRLYGLVGPNGSGKTTLLGVMSGITQPTSGLVRLRGEDYTDWSSYRVARHGIARTYQSIRLVPSLTVLENVMAGADRSRNGRMPWSADGEQRTARSASEALERVGLLDVADRSPIELPYGLRRRAEIARALVARPQLLLLDEPTAGMTHAERHDVAEMLTVLVGEGITLIVVEHDFGMIRRICEHIFVMHFGELIAQGAPDTVAADQLVREAYLGRKGATNP